MYPCAKISTQLDNANHAVRIQGRVLKMLAWDWVKEPYVSLVGLVSVHALCLVFKLRWNISLKPQTYLDSLKSERFLRGLLLRLFSLSSSGVSALRRKKDRRGFCYCSKVFSFFCFTFPQKELWQWIVCLKKIMFRDQIKQMNSSHLHSIRLDCWWFHLLFRSLLGSRNSQVVLGCQTFKKFIDKSHRLCNDKRKFQVNLPLPSFSLREQTAPLTWNVQTFALN